MYFYVGFDQNLLNQRFNSLLDWGVLRHEYTQSILKNSLYLHQYSMESVCLS